MTRKYLIALFVLGIVPALLLIAGSAMAATSTLVAPARADAHGARIVVPARDVLRGEVLGESDLTFAEAPAGTSAASTVTRFEDLTGMQTRRALRAGESLRPDDVRRPVVVTKGQTVTMKFIAPGVELTAMGRAMSEGGVGDTVSVQNPASFRMITAVITGPGAVRAADPAMPALTTARR